MSARAASLRSLLDELGLSCVVETGARFALDPRRKHFPTLLTEGRGKRVRMLCRAVDVAAELGTPVVSMWSGAAPSNLTPERGVGAAARRLRARARARGAARRAARLRARAGHVRRAPGRLRGAGPPARPPARARPHARRRALRLPRARPGARLHPARARPGSCTCTSRTCAAGVHEHLMFGDGELDLAGGARGAVGDRLQRAWSPWSCRVTLTRRTRPSRARSRCCGAVNARR